MLTSKSYTNNYLSFKIKLPICQSAFKFHIFNLSFPHNRFIWKYVHPLKTDQCTVDPIDDSKRRLPDGHFIDKCILYFYYGLLVGAKRWFFVRAEMCLWRWHMLLGCKTVWSYTSNNLCEVFRLTLSALFFYHFWMPHEEDRYGNWISNSLLISCSHQ